MPPPTPRDQTDRGIYRWVALLAGMIVFAGFARTYYLKNFFGSPALSTLVHLHGLVMTLWFGLFAVQVWLVKGGHISLHRSLGVAGAWLAVVVVVVGTLTALTAARTYIPPGAARWAFLSVPLGELTVFSILVSVAVGYRRRASVHKRLFLLANLGLLTAAVARIPLDFIADGGLELFFFLTDLPMIGCIGFDTIKNQQLHPAFRWGFLFVVATQSFRIYLAAPDHCQRFVAWLAA